METAACNLYGFIQECLQELRGIFNEAYVPDNPTINPGTWPYITMHGSTAEVGGNTPQELIWKNNPVIVIVMPLDDLARVNEFLMPYWEQIPITLQSAFVVNGRSKHAQNLGDLRMQLTIGPIEWIGGAEMFGITIQFGGVKITNTVPLAGS